MRGKVRKNKLHIVSRLFMSHSTGAILAFSLGIHHHSLDEIEQLYRELSREIFAVQRGDVFNNHLYALIEVEYNAAAL